MASTYIAECEKKQSKPLVPISTPEIERERQNLKRYQAKINELAHDLETLKRQQQQKEELIKSVDSRISIVKQDLEATRAVSGDEGTLVLEQVKSIFNELGMAIQELVNVIRQGIPPELGKRDILATLREENALQSSPLVEFIATGAYSKKGPIPETGLIIELSLHYQIRQMLMDRILKPFHPGLSDDQINLWKQLARQASKLESHDRSARWRAMTYSNLSNTVSIPVEELVGHLWESVQSLLASFHCTLPDNPQDTGIRPSLDKIIQLALYYQLATQVACLDWNFYTFIPEAGQFKSSHMASKSGRGKPTQVILPLGIVLQAYRYQKDGEIEGFYAFPTAVIADDWHPITSQG